MATAIDPICKMEVDTDNPSGGQTEYQGTSYYFCAPACKVAFEQDPGKYLSEQPEQAPPPEAPVQPKGSFFSRLFGRGS